MEKKIVVSIGTDEQVGIRARLSLLVVEGEQVLSRQYHSIGIVPGADLVALRNANEQHLAQPFAISGIPGAPWPSIPEEEWNKVKAVIDVFHTPEVVMKYEMQVAERVKQEQLLQEAQNAANAQAVIKAVGV